MSVAIAAAHGAARWAWQDVGCVTYGCGGTPTARAQESRLRDPPGVYWPQRPGSSLLPPYPRAAPGSLGIAGIPRAGEGLCTPSLRGEPKPEHPPPQDPEAVQPPQHRASHRRLHPEAAHLHRHGARAG